MPALSSHPLPASAVSEKVRSIRVTPITSEAAPKSSARPKTPLFAGRYAIDRYLDKGGTSKVYLGYDEQCEERVVIKILTDEAAKNATLRAHFLVGSRAALAVRHDNVVKTLAVRDPEPGTPYMVMELLSGELMADRLHRVGSFQPRAALALAARTASGLAALHAHGIVHCDIKPDNLFLTEAAGSSKGLKILDFGLAEVEGQGVENEMHAVRGTAQFMAPEQVLGDAVDASTDVYALGVVMFRMLTGVLPFDLKLSTTLLRHQLFSKAPPPSWLCDDLDPAIENIVLKAMRKNPANRYATALELLVDLDCVLDGHPPQSSFELGEEDVYRPRSEFAERAAAMIGR